MTSFNAEIVTSWPAFLEQVSRHKPEDQWIYRGHRCSNWDLKTSLERALQDWGQDMRTAHAIERQMIRDFQRSYIGDHAIIDKDTLHCLALMQHHGAPTRLLDWTYSPYVAAYFASESGATAGSVWCLNTTWCQDAASSIIGSTAISERNDKRDNCSFERLYMDNTTPSPFVFTENPFHLHPRLSVQQGVFLCPGDIRATFVDNLKALPGHQDRNHILKLDFDLSQGSATEVWTHLRRMNVNAAALFPGLDGFARSLKERIPLYEHIANRTRITSSR